MKKKIIGMLMACTMLASTSMSVSASQAHYDGETANVPISYDNQSSFCVNLPENIDLNNPEGYTFTADYVYITDSQALCVFAPEESIQMTNEWGATGTVKLHNNNGNCVAKFLRNETTSQTPMYAMFDGQEAGHYEGTATFTIQLTLKDSY